MVIESGAEPFRYAEVVAYFDGRVPSRGSGYLTSRNTVLTARHVVFGARMVSVRFAADTAEEQTIEVQEIVAPASDQSADIAVLRIEDIGTDLSRSAFGRLARRDGVVESHAVGFPFFKLKSYGATTGTPGAEKYRDSHDASGSIAMLSNMREDTYEFQTKKSSGNTGADDDPWSGMSGAAVWVNRCIVGVVKSHSEADGIGVLGVEPLSRLYQEPAGSVRQAQGLPEQLESLVDVSRGMSRASAISDAFAADARALAPRELQDRDDEIKDVVKFIASQSSYGWWQGGAYAGKTAFAATIAFKPPIGADVAFFFVIRRLTAQSTQSAYLVSMTQQLNAIAGSETVSIAGFPGQRGLYEVALEDAARASRSRGNKLVLIVDGLDEDQGIHLGSIASVLPANPPDGVKVLLTSRPHPGIPSDVPRDHPLRDCIPRAIADWPDAEQTRALAIEELKDNYAGGELQQRIIGLLTAAGGGLSLKDIAAILSVPALTLMRTLASSFARSFRTRLPAHSPQEENFYLFGHDTLREVAEELLAQELAPFRGLLSDWAQRYASSGWPTDTPEYLLTAYGTALSMAGYSEELFALVTDSRRQNQTIARTGSNATSLEELKLLRHHLSQSDQESPFRHAVISESMSRVTLPSLEPPQELPVALSRLGDYGSAEGWARQLKLPYVRATALCQVAIEAAVVYTDWAFQLAHDAVELAPAVKVSSARERLLAAAAGALAATQRTREALDVAETISDVAAKYACLGAVAEHVWQRDSKGGLEILEQASRNAPAVPATNFALARAGLLKAWALADKARAGDEVNAVLRLASGVVGRETSDTCIRAAILALVELGERTRAHELADQLTVRLEKSLVYAQMMDMVPVYWDDAPSLTRVVSIADGLPVSGRLSVLTQAYASNHHTGAAWLAPLLVRVESAIRALPTPPTRAQAFADAASRIAKADSAASRRMVFDCTRELRSSGASGLKDRILEGLLKASIDLGQLSTAARAMQGVSVAALRLELGRKIAYSAAQRGLWTEALALAKEISDPVLKEAMYVAIVTSAANQGVPVVVEAVVNSKDFVPSWEEIADILLPSLIVTETWPIAMKLCALLPNAADRDLAHASVSSGAANAGAHIWQSALVSITDKRTRATAGIRIAARANVVAAIAVRAAADVEDVVSSLSTRRSQRPVFTNANSPSRRQEEGSERSSVLQRISDVLIGLSPPRDRFDLILEHFPSLRIALDDLSGAESTTGGGPGNSPSTASAEPAYAVHLTLEEIGHQWRSITANYVYGGLDGSDKRPAALCESLSSTTWYEHVDALVSLGSGNLEMILDSVLSG